MLLCRYVPFLFVYLKFANGVAIHDLGGAWNVQDVQKLHKFEGIVPGGIYSDLMNNKIIGDIFYGFNDTSTRWVSKTNWTYTKQIIVEEKFYNNDIINLVFDGIDTFAEVSLNNVLIGTTDNMFLQYVFNVKSYLQVGENTISIKFLSPVEKAALLYDIQARDYAVPPKCVPDSYRGECHANHIRKMQASFSWDWGPAFPSVGIWKPVYLEGYHQSVIRHVTFETNGEKEWWIIKIKVYMSNPRTKDAITGSISVILSTNSETVEHTYGTHLLPNENDEYVFTKSFTIRKSYVSLWWPNGYGNAQLYQMNVTYKNKNNDTSIKTYKVGFRTISLVQDTVPSGKSFYFTVNNVPIFAKGTNSIPINILPEKGQDPDKVRFLLQSAKDAHMNMIRVWGGGVYESDLFYELADEMGILIWQDFMFACAMYPTNEKFLTSIKEEVRQQVRRLHYHPSIILWAGNNENEVALTQNWYGTGTKLEVFKKDFIRLYEDTVKVETLANDPTRPFLSSSPTNGKAFIRDTPQDEFYGDVHYYNYGLNPWIQSNFPVTRFASEYGLQSLPTLSSWLTATDNISDLAFNSTFFNHRQHFPDGNAKLFDMVSQQMELPSKDSDTFFKTFIFYSQIIQAMGVKQQTENYRLWRGNTDENGRGLTMGALYWQLNDVWVAPSWSGIDFNSNWKMLHYFARNFFSPIIVATYLSYNRDLNVYVVSDLMNNSSNNVLTLLVYNWMTMVPIHQQTIVVDALAGSSKSVYKTSIDKYLKHAGCDDYNARSYCFMYFTLTDTNNKQIAPDNFVFPNPLQKSNLPAANVVVKAITQLDVEGKEFQITVNTNAIALFVWLESGAVRGIFSDNGFLQVTETKNVTFKAEWKTTVTNLTSAITVTHLQDPEHLK